MHWHTLLQTAMLDLLAMRHLCIPMWKFTGIHFKSTLSQLWKRADRFSFLSFMTAHLLLSTDYIIMSLDLTQMMLQFIIFLIELFVYERYYIKAFIHWMVCASTMRQVHKSYYSSYSNWTYLGCIDDTYSLLIYCLFYRISCAKF